MIKRVILGSLVAVGTTLFFVGRDAASYVGTAFGYVKDSVTGSVPVEFQLERARHMLKDLAPEVQKNIYLIAREEVEVQHLQAQIGDNETRLAKEKQQLTDLNRVVTQNKKEVQYGGRSYTIEQVKLDLSRRFERYRTGDATLSSMRQLCEARQKSLEAGRQKLEGMLAARRQLQVEIENIEARNQMVAAAQTTSNYHFDESRLGRLKELISDLKTRVDVNERLVNAEQYYHDEIPVEKVAPEDICTQITQYFGNKPQPQAEKVAKK